MVTFSSVHWILRYLVSILAHIFNMVPQLAMVFFFFFYLRVIYNRRFLSPLFSIVLPSLVIREVWPLLQLIYWVIFVCSHYLFHWFFMNLFVLILHVILAHLIVNVAFLVSRLLSIRMVVDFSTRSHFHKLSALRDLRVSNLLTFADGNRLTDWEILTRLFETKVIISIIFDGLAKDHVVSGLNRLQFTKVFSTQAPTSRFNFIGIDILCAIYLLFHRLFACLIIVDYLRHVLLLFLSSCREINHISATTTSSYLLIFTTLSLLLFHLVLFSFPNLFLFNVNLTNSLPPILIFFLLLLLFNFLYYFDKFFRFCLLFFFWVHFPLILIPQFLQPIFFD